MKITLNCPSYKRPKVETLKLFPFCKVWVDSDEFEDYVENNPKGSNIISCPKGVQGNVSRIRNYILDKEFKNGVDCVIIIDDDMNKIAQFIEGENHFGYESIELTKDWFFDWAEKYSKMCEEFGFKLWGMNCNSDSMSYRQYSPFSTTSVVLGPFSAHLKNDIRYDENLPLKEDYDIAIQHLNRYRGVLRLNSWHYVCKQSKQAGGCASYRTEEREREQFNLLQKKWGTEIIRQDYSNKGKTNKEKGRLDYNPIIKVPIKGV